MPFGDLHGVREDVGELEVVGKRDVGRPEEVFPLRHELPAVDAVEGPEEGQIGTREEQIAVYDGHFFLNFARHFLPILLFIAQPLDQYLHILRTFIILPDFSRRLLQFLFVLQYSAL